MRKHLEAVLWTVVVAVAVVLVIFQIGVLRRAVTAPHLGKLSA